MKQEQKTENEPQKNIKNAPLVEGIDYYLEGGKFVFTSTYHLKRGYCCQSGCRHCPFGNKK